MNLDELRSVQRTERQKDSLQHLRDSFYTDVAQYIEQLKDERQRAADQADDPFSAPDVQRLTDEIETAEDIVESVYERRVGKVVKLASFAAADMPAETEGLTEEEQVLFEDLVGRIQTNRRTVLDTLAGKRLAGDAAAADGAATARGDAPPNGEVDVRDDAPPTEAPDALDDPTAVPSDGPTDPTPEADAGPDPTRHSTGDADAGPADDAGGVLSEAMGGENADHDESASSPDTDDAPTPPPDTDDAPSPPPDVPPAAERTDESPAEGDADDADAADPERTTVRILDDVGEIFGVDERAYELDRETVVTLPSANAEPLIERDAAERID